MLGAIVGDIIGSPYHMGGMKSEDFELFTENSKPTDETVLTLATAEALMSSMLQRGDKTTGADFAEKMKFSLRGLCKHYVKKVRFGKSYFAWLMARVPHPFNSHGNNPVVRVSPVAWAFDDLETVEWFAEISAVVTHDNPDGINGARSAAGAVFLARTKHTKDDIRGYLSGKGYDLSRTLDEIRPEYVYSSSCAGSLSEAFTAFLEGKSFEDVVRKAVSLGGEADALASISGAIAEPMFGISTLTQVNAFEKLRGNMKRIVQKWEQWRD